MEFLTVGTSKNVPHTIASNTPATATANSKPIATRGHCRFLTAAVPAARSQFTRRVLPDGGHGERNPVKKLAFRIEV